MAVLIQLYCLPYYHDILRMAAKCMQNEDLKVTKSLPVCSDVISVPF